VRTVCGLFLAFAVGSVGAQSQTTIIKAQKIMTAGDAGTVGPALIVVRDGKITSVDLDSGESQPAGAQVLSAKVVTPGLIDARTTLGLSGLIPVDDDRDEVSGPNQAHLRAIDAFNLREPMLEHALRSGVTLVQTGPGTANSMGGQAGLFKTHGSSTEKVTVRFPSGLVVALTESAKMTYGKERKFPTTRMANVGLIRQAFVDAERYDKLRAGDDPPPRDLSKEALALVLNKQIPVLISAERVDEIATARRLAEEFGWVWALVGASAAHLVLEHLAEASVPVLLGPPGNYAYKDDASETTLSLPADMARRGIPFALVSGDDEAAPHVTLVERAQRAVRNGLSAERALRAITIDAARILRIDDRVGSVEAGKDADLVLYDGDPFSYATRVEAVLVNGKVAYQRRD
jgi:imidazolonepropionase-like amidohydrolase